MFFTSYGFFIFSKHNITQKQNIYYIVTFIKYILDIDECSTGSHDCHVHSTCTNTTGSFSCACNEGFSGDGVNCVDRNNSPFLLCSISSYKMFKKNGIYVCMSIPISKCHALFVNVRISMRKLMNTDWLGGTIASLVGVLY